MSSKTTRIRRLLGDRFKDDDLQTTYVNRPFTSVAMNVTDSLFSTGKSNIDNHKINRTQLLKYQHLCSYLIYLMSFYLFKSIFLGDK